MTERYVASIKFPHHVLDTTTGEYVKGLGPYRLFKSALRHASKLNTSAATAPVVTDDEWRDAAIEEWARDGEIEFDHDAQVSVSESSDGIIGAYVQAWVWVGNPELLA